MTSRKRSAEDLEQIISARIPPTTMARLERLKPYLFPDPSIIPSRSAIIRAALEGGLPLMERQFLGASGVLVHGGRGVGESSGASVAEPSQARKGEEWDCVDDVANQEREPSKMSQESFTSKSLTDQGSIATAKILGSPAFTATDLEGSKEFLVSPELPEEGPE